MCAYASSWTLLGHPLFFRLLWNTFSDFGSVGRKKKGINKIGKLSGARRLGTSPSYPWSLKTTRCGYKVNMAAKEEGNIDFVVRIKREQGKS